MCLHTRCLLALQLKHLVLNLWISLLFLCYTLSTQSYLLILSLLWRLHPRIPWAWSVQALVKTLIEALQDEALLRDNQLLNTLIPIILLYIHDPTVVTIISVRCQGYLPKVFDRGLDYFPVLAPIALQNLPSCTPNGALIKGTLRKGTRKGTYLLTATNLVLVLLVGTFTQDSGTHGWCWIR